MNNKNSKDWKGSTILIVEDEESLAVGLEFNLREEGYEVVWAQNGRTALEEFESKTIDLVILDIMLPYVNGFEVAQRIREASPQIPILMLTAKTRPVDRIHGLESGADDYLVKPFHLKELLLRISGMLKRKAWYRQTLEALTSYSFGNITIDFTNLTGVAGKRMFRLTPLEATLLNYLISNAGNIVSKQELLDKVWQIKSEVETRTVDNFIARLRKYVEPHPSNPIYITNVRGAGYMFTPAPTEKARG